MKAYWSLAQKIMLRLALAGIAGFLCLEAGLWLLIRAGVLPLHKPTYSMANARSRFWVDANTNFGVWHEPGSTYRHLTSCFDLRYTANSYGARDIERERTAGDRPRVAVLGDSFIEGYGVFSADRLSDRLEKATRIEHLNFGTSGAFGPTQYYLLYKTLAKQFEHDAVLVALLPDNDFLDDDYEHAQTRYRDRYRPYFVGRHPDYNLVAFGERMEDKPGRLLENIVRQFSHAGIFLKHLKGRLRHASAGGTENYSGYFDYTPEQWLRLTHVLRLLREEAGSRKMLLITIPCQNDIERANRDGPPPLPAQLAAFCREQDIAYRDLLEVIRKAPLGYASCYLPCDRHWSAYGNQVAADYLLQQYGQLAFLAPATSPSPP